MTPQVQGLEVVKEKVIYRDEAQKVFVYGTLKRGYGNHAGHLGDARFLGIACVEGLMFHLGGFPAICTDEPFNTISGEVYEVSWDHMFQMDSLEGVGRNFYDRIQVNVKPFGKVWAYVFSEQRVRERIKSLGRVIPSGIWRGAQSNTVEWKGFNRGIQIGKFMTNAADDEIRVGDGDGYLLRKDQERKLFILIHKPSGEALGEYKYMKDINGEGHKPTIRLKPHITVVSDSTPTVVHPTVRDIMEARVRSLNNTNLPLVIPQNKEPEEKPLPQAARLFGVNYREA